MADQELPDATVAQARELAQCHAARGEASRSLHPQVLEAIIAAGFTRHLVPARWGGREGSFTTLTGAVSSLGRGCTSAAWLASVFAYSARFGAYLPDEGQAELWSKGAHAVVAAGLVPSGSAVPVAQGWRVRGEWPYTSGAELADWTLLCVRADGSDALFAVLPRCDISVADTWSTLGMRATASHTVLVDDVIVPAHRVFRRDVLMQGRAVHNDGGGYRVPLRAVSGITFAAPLVGAAQGALADYVACHQAGGAPTALPPDAALAAGEIDAAALLVQRSAQIADRGAVTEGEVARSLRDAALAATLLRTAADRLIGLAGTRGQAEQRPLQRFWRDLNTASTHVALRFTGASSSWSEHAARPGGLRHVDTELDQDTGLDQEENR